MISRVNSAVCNGITGEPVIAETDLSNGLPQMHIVGLPSTMVMESKDRIKSAILNSGYEYPRRRITVNLTPAGIRKTGAHLDLPIAVGILTAMRYISTGNVSRYGIIGELSLEGRVLPVEGVLPMILGMKKRGIRQFMIPAANLPEALLAEEIRVCGVDSLSDCVQKIHEGSGAWADSKPAFSQMNNVLESKPEIDFSDIRGQESAKRAAVIAAAGNHGLFLMGNPGCGKTMLARRISTILPPMTRQEIIEDTIIYSVMGKVDPAEGGIRKRPFRMPHHSIGRSGLIGGGIWPIPGEVTLAHNGVLFLDEVSEFKREVLESLRIPIEDHTITHFRNGQAYQYPCRFLLVMAANPCPCGFNGDPDHECRCSFVQRENYRRKLSGAMLERVDIMVNMEKVQYKDLKGRDPAAVSSGELRRQVTDARAFAAATGRKKISGELNDKEVRQLELSAEAERFMSSAYDKLHLSPRTYIKALRVARTIADLDQSPRIEIQHISESLSYRMALYDFGNGAE